MIDHWLDVPGRAAIERMGWPEWDGRRDAWSNETGEHEVECRMRIVMWSDEDDPLNPSAWCLEYKHDGHWFAKMVDAPTRIPLALLRDHAREWLAEHGCTDPDYPDVSISESDGDWWIGAESSGDDGYWELAHDADYDAALVAAVLATDA